MGSGLSCTYVPHDESTEPSVSEKPKVENEEKEPELPMPTPEEMGEWSLEQDKSLLMLHKIYVNNPDKWSSISRNVAHSSNQVQARNRYLVKNPPPENEPPKAVVEKNEPTFEKKEKTADTQAGEKKAAVVVEKVAAEPEPTVDILDKYKGRWEETRVKDREGDFSKVLKKVGVGMMIRSIASSQLAKFLIKDGTNEGLYMKNLGNGEELDNITPGCELKNRKNPAMGKINIQVEITAEHIMMTNTQVKGNKVLKITRLVDGDTMKQTLDCGGEFVTMKMTRKPL